MTVCLCTCILCNIMYKASLTELYSFIFRSFAVSLHVLLFPLVGWDKLLLSMRTEGGRERGEKGTLWILDGAFVAFRFITTVAYCEFWPQGFDLNLKWPSRLKSEDERWRYDGGRRDAGQVWRSVRRYVGGWEGAGFTGPQLTIQDPLNTWTAVASSLALKSLIYWKTNLLVNLLYGHASPHTHVHSHACTNNTHTHIQWVLSEPVVL